MLGRRGKIFLPFQAHVQVCGGGESSPRVPERSAGLPRVFFGNRGAVYTLPQDRDWSQTMWLSYHIPLTDLRAFSDAPTGQLTLPVWGQPGRQGSFVRSFGAFTARQPMHAGWMRESAVCDARSALRIAPQVTLPVVDRERTPEVLFRQVASDGGAVVRVDLGLWIDLPSDGLDAAAAIRLIGALLDMPVGVHISRPHATGLTEVRLLGAGPALAEAWLWATTTTADTPPGDGWVLDGMPVLFVSLASGESLKLPASVQHTMVASEADLDLKHFIHVHQGREVRLWVLRPKPEADLFRAYTLEVSLKRLHVEMVCMHTLLSRLGDGEPRPMGALLGPSAPPSVAPAPRSPASQRLQRSLRDMSRRLRQLSRTVLKTQPPGMPVHGGLTHPETNTADVEPAIHHIDEVLRRQDVRPNIAKSVREVLHLMPGVLEVGNSVAHSLWRSPWSDTLPTMLEPPPREGSLALERAAPPVVPDPETLRLQWNTGFPNDTTVEKARILLAGFPYLLRTAIQAGENTIGSLTPGETIPPPGEEHLETTPEGERFFTVRFGIGVTGAVVRPAGSALPPGPEAMSELLPCVLGRGTRAFDLELTATAAGQVSCELTLYVNGGATLRRIVALTAIAVGGGDQPVADGLSGAETASRGDGGGVLSPQQSDSPNAPMLSMPSRPASSSGAPTGLAAPLGALPTLEAVALPVESLLRLCPTEVYLGVSLRDGNYWLRLITGSVGYDQVCAALGDEVLFDTIIAQRNELVKLSSAYRAEAAQADDPLAGLRLLEPPDALLSFARIGAQLHCALFGQRGDLGVPQVLHVLANKIAQLGRGAVQPPHMQIDAELLPVPWAVLYDGPEPKTAAEVDLQAFWGVRFQIHRVAMVTLVEVPANAAARPQRVIACLNPHLDQEQQIAVLANQRTFFQGAPISATLIESDADLEVFLQAQVDEAPCSLLYFFCHATAAQTLNRNLFRDLRNPGDAAIIELDKLPISIKQLRTLRIAPLPAQPLVFMNTCSSAQGDRVFQSVFLTHFFGTWRASGFIGTDWKMPTVFADRFARLFLKDFLIDRHPVADAFYSAARQVLEIGNPFPLIYALYVRPDHTF